MIFKTIPANPWQPMKSSVLKLLIPFTFCFIVAGCSGSVIPRISNSNPGGTTQGSDGTAGTPTPFKPLPTATVTPTPTQPPDIKVWLPDWTPAGIVSAATLEKPFIFTQDKEKADITLNLSGEGADVHWVYAVVAPFPTLTDGITGEELRANWAGNGNPQRTILVDESTAGVFAALWGDPDQNAVHMMEAAAMLDTAWSAKNTWAIIPFTEISPRWKVLQLNGLSPFDRDLDLAAYPLVVGFAWEGRTAVGQDKVQVLRQAVSGLTNRDESKLTRVMLTGTTALVRMTAERMQTNGVEYPIGDILPWLLDADITHISNEISFYDQCPPATPERLGTRFCTNPDFIKLLDLIDVDVIELTGNHLVDYGRDALTKTLEMYRERGIPYYGGGDNLTESVKPLIVEHNGNRIGFIGCNKAGPESDWATDDRPGSAPCDLDQMAEDVQNLLDEGVIPIVTFQHFELEDFMPISLARQDMQKMAQAGAVIVSGSQAHFPHGFTFVGDNFVHYGLGNLFFDQMWPNHRREFLDRHIFYDGHYLGVELLTAMLEDYARPRPMTNEERVKMLTTYFEVSGWQISDKE